MSEEFLFFCAVGLWVQSVSIRIAFVENGSKLEVSFGTFFTIVILDESKKDEKRDEILLKVS